MTSLVALSFSPALTEPARVDLVSRAARALAAHAGETATVMPSGHDEQILATNRTDGHARDRFALALSAGPSLGDGVRLTEQTFSAALAGGADRLARFSPPFAACWRVSRDQPIMAATDLCGERHLYWWQGDHWAAVATSSLVLGSLTGSELDESAVGVVALVGYHVGLNSWFRGVRKLGAGERCTLQAGRVQVAAYASPPAIGGDQMSFTGAVEAGQSVVTRMIAADLEANADAAMELSGGLDSRTILAAIPPSRRAGMTAYTLGPASSADVRIAVQIAQRWRMDHRFVDIDRLADLDVAEALELVERAGRRQDFGRDPMSAGVLWWAEAKFDQGPRFTGLNGEFARGMWYGGQPSHARVSTALVDRLVTWRMFLNNAIDGSILDPTFLADSRADVLRTVRQTIEDFEGDWLQTCDEVYMRERMRPWAGSQLSAACVDRPVLAPFLRGPFLEWARGTSPRFKRRSRIFAAVVERLDADLARVPLDSGLSPRDLAQPGLRARLRLADQLGRKASRKVAQRFVRRSRPGVGAPLLAELVAQGWQATKGALDGVSQLPFVNAAVLHEIETGRRPIDATTVGFLAGLRGTLTFVSSR